jgi:1-acyl-sn-glycerol-3-phosphate acyltransferase
MDIAAMLMALPEIRFLAAADLFRIPLLSAAMRALDTVPIERRDPAVARQQLTDLIDQREENDSYSLVIFPEGGIAPRGERLPFKTGAFALAIQTGMSIVPVLIIHSDDVLPPKGRLAVRSGKVIVKLFAPISSEGLTIEDRGALRDRARDVVVNAWEACERDTTEHA